MNTKRILEALIARQKIAIEAKNPDCSPEYNHQLDGEIYGLAQAIQVVLLFSGSLNDEANEI